MNQKKIAIFVEGQTEQLFITQLLEEIAGYKNISITVYKFQGNKSNRTCQFLNNKEIKNSPFFALLYNCDGDSSLVSDINKQHQSLTKNNYQKIIGLRDLYPEPFERQKIIENGIKGFLKPLKKNGIPINVILAIMEIEAWFLAEYKCFSKINNILTADFILQKCGIDLVNMDVEQIPHPSEYFNNIYQLIGRNYDKNEEQVKDIVKYLDYEFIYLELVNKIKQLEKLIKEIDSFLVWES